MNIENEKKLMLTLVKNGLNGENESAASNEIDYKKLFEIADKHSVNMLCLDGAKHIVDKIPSDIYYDWIYFASRKMTINENVLKIQQKLTEILENNNISYFIFKGLCSASYYKKPELRELGDIDFYVDFSDFKKADELLKNNGFKLVSTDDDKHWNYKYDDVELEMHHGFWDMPDNQCVDFLLDIINSSANQPKKYKIKDYTFYGANTIAHSVILVIHIINHLQQGGIGVRHICDFAAFLNSDDFKNNYDEIIKIYKKGGIFKTAQATAKICSLYLGTPEYDFIKHTDERLLSDFLEDILNSGNFGRLSKETYHGSALFTTNKTQNSSFFKSMSSFCKNSWAPCKKHKILLIIAPFYIGIKYFFRAITGKRPKINPIKYTKTGVKRAELYKRLDFFEED
ncbi:MAG: nucleotidyltransferase family protein [Acutalibacteraceae bacterium]|nr:nucleotidyltransferase family protein [Acutalibacteraceae bacterium]